MISGKGNECDSFQVLSRIVDLAWVCKRSDTSCVLIRRCSIESGFWLQTNVPSPSSHTVAFCPVSYKLYCEIYNRLGVCTRAACSLRNDTSICLCSLYLKYSTLRSLFLLHYLMCWLSYTAEQKNVLNLKVHSRDILTFIPEYRLLCCVSSHTLVYLLAILNA